MLKDLGHAMGVDVLDETAEAIHKDSGGHPRFARLLASAAYLQRGDSEELGLTQYQQGLTWLRDDNGGADDFIRENIWRHVTSAERTVLGRSFDEDGADNAALETTGMATSADAGQTISTTLDSGTLREARQHLIATGLLEKINNQLRANGALVREWIRETVR